MTNVRTRDELLCNIIKELWRNIDTRKYLMMTREENDLLFRVINGG